MLLAVVDLVIIALDETKLEVRRHFFVELLPGKTTSLIDPGAGNREQGNELAYH